MRAVITKLLLVLALVGVTLADRSVEAERASERSGSVRVDPLIPDAVKPDMVVAAVTLRRGDGPEMLYARSGGVWRCREMHNAVADWQAIGSLVELFMGASGVLQSDVPERFGDYGIGVERSFHLSLHGPGLMKKADRDVLFAVEIGDPLDALDGCFVRVAGEDRVRVIDQNPLPILVPPGSHPQATPLLDTHLVPGAWLGPGDRVRKVLVERPDGAFSLELRDRVLAPGDPAIGTAPYEWVVVRADGSEASPSVDHATAFSIFLTLCDWVAVLDPDRGDELGMGQLAGRVTLQAAHAPPTLLAFGPRSADGYVPVFNGWSQMLVVLPADVAELCLPEAEALIDGSLENPWEPWLVAASQAALANRQLR